MKLYIPVSSPPAFESDFERRVNGTDGGHDPY